MFPFSMPSEKELYYVSKLIRTLVLYACFLAFGISRSLQGPTLLELQKQVNVNIETFQIVFLLGAITFPAGNFLAGFVIEKCNPSMFLSFSTVVLALSVSFIPFAANIAVLATTSSAAEFAMGMLDTGANVYCLQVWQDNSGPYFNALHLSQSLGFMLAPILAEKVLPSTNDGRSAIQTSADTNDTVQIIPVATGVQMFDHMNTMFSPIQALYLAIGFFTFLIAVCFLAGIPADKKTGSYSVRDKAKSFEEDKEKQRPDQKTDNWIYSSIILSMTLYCVASNGMSFSFGHFLTTYSVKSSLMLSQQDGARLTSIYYGAQVFIRFVNIFLVLRVRRLHLVVLYLSLVGLGAATLIISPTLWALRIGCVLVGLGGGSLFPIGLLWLQGELEVSGKVASLFCVGTTVGAQLFRFPEAAFIDKVPEVHLYLLFSALLASIASFATAVFSVRWRKAREEAAAGGELVLPPLQPSLSLSEIEEEEGGQRHQQQQQQQNGRTNYENMFSLPKF